MAKPAGFNPFPQQQQQQMVSLEEVWLHADIILHFLQSLYLFQFLNNLDVR